MINVIFGSSVTVNWPLKMFLDSQVSSVLKDIQVITNYSGSAGSAEIQVEVSEEVKNTYSVPYYELYEDVEDFFDTIDGSGEIPPEYDRYRRDWEKYKDDDARRKNFYDSLERKIIVGWSGWADEVGDSELKKKMKRVLGKIYARKKLLAVSYDNVTKTVTLYKNVIGPYPAMAEEWRLYFACGLFYAWYYECGGKSHKEYVIEGLCTDFQYSMLMRSGNDGVADNLLWELSCADMFDIPEASMQYMENITLERSMNWSIFRQAFNLALQNATLVEDYIKAAYFLYEGYPAEEKKAPAGKSSVKSGMKGGRDRSKYLYNGKEYLKSQLPLAVIKEFTADKRNAGKDLFAEFPWKRKHFIQELVDAKKYTGTRFYMDPSNQINWNGKVYVVSNQWDASTISQFIKIAAANGYTIYKV